MKRTIIAAASIALLGACATSPENIKPHFVPSSAYSSATCEELDADLKDARARLAIMLREQGEDAQADAVAMGIGLLVFAPALLVLAATDDREEEIGQLSGEVEGMTNAYVQKSC